MADIFGENLLGIYLTGSIVLDGFHEGKSDVDCTVLLTCPPNKDQVDKIKKRTVLSRRNIKVCPWKVNISHWIIFKK